MTPAKFERLRPEDREIVWRLGAIYKQRSLRYFEGGPFGSRMRDDDYMAAAYEIVIEARDMERYGGREGHSFRTWMAIIGGPDLESILMGPDPRRRVERVEPNEAEPNSEQTIELVTSMGRRVIQL